MIRKLLPALLLLVACSACKKDEGSGPESAFEPLGDLAPEHALGFSVSGAPLIRKNDHVYEWNSETASWRTIGGSTAGNVLSLFGDARSDYYAHDGRYLLRSVGGTAAWDTVQVASANPGLCNAVVMNGLGDLVVRVSSGPDSVSYYRKGGAETAWTKVITGSARSGDEERHVPAYLSNSGMLYYNFDNQLGYLTDLTLNTRTGQYGLLYDKTAPGNINLGGTGILYGNQYVSPDGEVWGTAEDFSLYHLSGASLPAKIERLPAYRDPGLHESAWHTLMGPIVVDAERRLRCLITCNKYPESHWSPATAGTAGGDFNVVQHAMGQRSLRANFKGEVFLWAYNGLLYRWK